MQGQQKFQTNHDNRGLVDVKPRIADEATEKSRGWKLTEINEPSQCRSLRLPDAVPAMRYELPFYYPGQICAGKVTTLHLYQGAFVDIGGVYEGWVPIKGNDWYWIRHHIKVGMNVFVEILAKRDPYRFRFPIEMRFVDPNIDHLMYVALYH